jgi:chromosome segregation ATPase
MLRQQNEELRAENSRLKSGREEDMLEAQHLANYAAEAWDNFLKRHEEELVNLRKISNQRKKEVAKLNQELAEQQEFARTYKEWWQQSEANESHLQNKLDKAKWTEDSLRFEIECLRESILKSETELSEYRKREQHPMLEVRQAHQEADQWQHRYEEAQERLEAVTKVLNVVQDNLDKAVDVASYGTEARAQR